MPGEAPKWKGLFDWSMKYQDGTHPSNEGAKPVTSEDAKWFREAMAHYMQDFTERMRLIKGRLGGEGTEGSAATSVEEKERLLDELNEVVESIDYARDLRSIGGLPILLALLESEEPSLRWRSAEVLATCAQNNPPVQQWFMEAAAMPALVARLADEDAAVRQKALMALSCLLRHNLDGLAAFVQADGLAHLVRASGDAEPRVQRKALQLLSYTLGERPGDRAAVGDLGLIPILVELLHCSDSDIQEAALAVAVMYAEPPQQVHYLREEAVAWEVAEEAGASVGAVTIMGSQPEYLISAEGFGERVSALQGQLAKLEGDDLRAVLTSASMCSSLAGVLSRPDGAPDPDAAPAVAARAEPVVEAAGSSPAPGVLAEAQPPLLLGAP